MTSEGVTPRLDHFAERVASRIVAEGLRRLDVLERAIPRPPGSTEAPREVALERFDRLMVVDQVGKAQGLGYVGSRALAKLFGPRIVAQEYADLTQEWLQAKGYSSFEEWEAVAQQEMASGTQEEA